MQDTDDFHLMIRDSVEDYVLPFDQAPIAGLHLKSSATDAWKLSDLLTSVHHFVQEVHGCSGAGLTDVLLNFEQVLTRLSAKTSFTARFFFGVQLIAGAIR